CNLFGGLLRRYYFKHLELDNVAPIRDPLIEKLAIGRFHNLKAVLEFFIDPTRNVLQAVRSEASAITEASIHRNRIVVPEMFNNHVEHNDSQDWLRAGLRHCCSTGQRSAGADRNGGTPLGVG